MQKIENFLHHFFIDGLNGMANGLFVTLVLGTFLSEIGILLGGNHGNLIHLMGVAAISATSLGIGIGVAVIYQEPMLVTLSSAIAAFVGGNATAILDGSLIRGGSVVINGSGEPLGAFLAAFVACSIGHLLSKKTSADYLLTPVFSICLGSAAGLYLAPRITSMLLKIQHIIEWGGQKNLLGMSMVVGVVIGMCCTLPVSAVSICVLLNLNGYAAGAAAIGCCCNMVGLAITGFHDNSLESLFTVGLGTSKLQMANIVRHPQTWIPSIVASAICAPIGVVIAGLQNTAVGAGMGTCAFAGQIATFQAMRSTGEDGRITLIKILVFHFLLPAFLSYFITVSMRRTKMIPEGSMKIRSEK